MGGSPGTGVQDTMRYVLSPGARALLPGARRPSARALGYTLPLLSELYRFRTPLVAQLFRSSLQRARACFLSSACVLESQAQDRRPTAVLGARSPDGRTHLRREPLSQREDATWAKASCCAVTMGLSGGANEALLPLRAAPKGWPRRSQTNRQEGFSVDCFLSAAFTSGSPLIASLKFLIP